MIVRTGPNTDPGVPDALLVIRRSSESEESDLDEFVCMAAPNHLTTLGVGAPSTGQEYYLADSWILDFVSPFSMADAITAIKNRVDLLAESLALMSAVELVDPEEYTSEYEVVDGG